MKSKFGINDLVRCENEYLMDIQHRNIILSDGERHIIEMSRLHWVWYDRFSVKYEYFVEMIMGDLLDRAKNLIVTESGRQFTPSEALMWHIEFNVEKEISEGKDPFETSGERLIRKSKLWKIKQARRESARE